MKVIHVIIVAGLVNFVTVCPAGTYDSLDDDQEACLNCPMNTAIDVEGAVICSCLPGFFRYEEDPQVDCTRKLNLRKNTCHALSLQLRQAL